ncbi:Conserved_hypothetical protein [Hexamita inflata]|uniref:Uncharacterized protein n=1 Tax=Hexamita inflata TaxID=28002 RepID=A0AA86U6F5_9EUKA|nr:Conserved hypothetical protein [Hexamita inflata]
MIDTFSTLGSWASWRNPKGWFMFSIGLIVSLFVVLPLIPYQHCRIKYVNMALSYLVTVSLYLGCLCFLMVAFFPTVRTSISGGKIKFSNVHGISALSGGALFIIGYLVLFIMVLIDKCKKKIVFGPAFTASMIVLVVFFIIALIANVTWIIIYPQRYRNDPSIGDDRNDASAFSFYSFSMWENLGIYLIFTFFLTSPFMLHHRSDGKFTVQNESKRLFPKKERIQLKTELSVIWNQIINGRNISKRKQCVLLEHLADYQVEADDEIVSVLYKIENPRYKMILQLFRYIQQETINQSQ